MSDC